MVYATGVMRNETTTTRKGETMKELRFKMTKRGLRAYYYSRPQMRWFPMPVEEAKLAIATGQAFEVEGVSV